MSWTVAPEVQQHHWRGYIYRCVRGGEGGGEGEENFLFFIIIGRETKFNALLKNRIVCENAH